MDSGWYTQQGQGDLAVYATWNRLTLTTHGERRRLLLQNRDSDETNSTETEATAKVDFYEMIVSGNEQFNNCFIAHRRHCFTDNYAISQRTVTEEKL